MRKTIWILCMMILSITVSAQSKSEKELMEAVERLKKAMIDGNKGQLESIIADELSYGHSNGKIEDKTAFIESIASGKADFLTIDLSEQTIKISYKTAIVRHNFLATIKDGDKSSTLKLGVMLIWQKQHGQWKFLARQAYKI